MRSSFFLSSLMGSDLSCLIGLQKTLIFCHLARQRWLDEEFLLSLKLDGLSPFKLQMTLIFCHLAKQRWLDEVFLLSLKLDGLSPFKLDGILDASDLLSSSQAEVA
jgi:hypothetical protein